MKIGELELTLYADWEFLDLLNKIKNHKQLKNIIASRKLVSTNHHVLGLDKMFLDKFPIGTQLANYFPIIIERQLMFMKKDWGHILLLMLAIAVEKYKELGKPGEPDLGFLQPVYGIKNGVAL